MMSPKTFFRTALLSFHSRTLYAMVAKQWKGFGLSVIFYLMLAMTVCQGLATWNVFKTTHHYIASNQPDLPAPNTFARIISALITNFPKLRMHQGEAELEGNQPYYIQDPLTKATLLIIDTTDHPSHDNEAMIKITRHAVHINGNYQNSIPIHKIFGKYSRYIGSDELRRMSLEILTALLHIFPWVTPLIFIAFYILHYIRVTFFALVCLVVGRLQKVDITMRGYLRLAAVALIPSTLWRIVLYSSNLVEYLPGIILLLGDITLAVGYMIFAFRSARSVKTSETF